MKWKNCLNCISQRLLKLRSWHWLNQICLGREWRTHCIRHWRRSVSDWHQQFLVCIYFKTCLTLQACDHKVSDVFLKLALEAHKTWPKPPLTPLGICLCKTAIVHYRGKKKELLWGAGKRSYQWIHAIFFLTFNLPAYTFSSLFILTLPMQLWLSSSNGY